MKSPDLLSLLHNTLSTGVTSTTTTPTATTNTTTVEHLQLVHSILQEDRKAKEAELASKQEDIRLKELEIAAKREETRFKELELAILREQRTGNRTSPAQHIFDQPPQTSVHNAGSSYTLPGTQSDNGFSYAGLLASTITQDNRELSFQSIPVNGIQFPDLCELSNDGGDYTSLMTQQIADLSFDPRPITGEAAGSELVDSQSFWDDPLWSSELFTRILPSDDSENPTTSSIESLDSQPSDAPPPSGLRQTLMSDPATVFTSPSTVFGSPAPPSSTTSEMNTITSTFPTFPLPSTRSSKKSGIAVTIYCRSCSTVIAHCQLHGTSEQADGYIPDFACVTCAQAAGWSVKKTQKEKRRQNGHSPADTPVRCHICKCLSAAGGFRLPFAMDVNGKTDFTWNAPDFPVEFQCDQCRQEFALCSDCGGGGKFRTGKWRPVQMFQAGRATCSSDHIRMSGIQTTTGVFYLNHTQYPWPSSSADAPESLSFSTDMILRALQGCAWRSLGVPLSTPKKMRAMESIKDWEHLSNQIDHMCKTFEAEFLGHGTKTKPVFLEPPYNGNPNLARTYLAMQWISTPGNHDGMSVWKPGDNETREDNATRKDVPKVLAFDFADWHVDKGVILASVGLYSSKIHRGAMCDLLRRILQDYDVMVQNAHTTNLAPPPIRPKWVQIDACIVSSKTGKQFQNDPVHSFGKKGWKLLSEEPACPWTPEMAKQLSDDVLLVTQTYHLVADIDEFLEFWANMDADGSDRTIGESGNETLSVRPKKRSLKS
ncbi:hypothetical protein DFJ77DRAFT_465669 [Powellomyces hirtus]|nr:hypothetical protein DFJ77DRAFT_465669 [Powellomyces hirtus]